MSRNNVKHTFRSHTPGECPDFSALKGASLDLRRMRKTKPAGGGRPQPHGELRSGLTLALLRLKGLLPA